MYKTSNLDNYMRNKLNNETFVDMLLRLIDEKGLTDAEVYKKALLDRRYFSKVRCDRFYKPKKKTVVALALALELDNPTSKVFIKKAGYILTGASRFDVLILYCIQNEIYDLFKVNALLHDEGLDTIP